MDTATDTPIWTTGDRLRKAREWAGVGSQQMAEALGVTRNTITNYEHDRTEPTLSALRRWSEVTGVPVAWLLETQGEAGSRSRCSSHNDVFVAGGEVVHYPHLPFRLAA